MTKYQKYTLNEKIHIVEETINTPISVIARRYNMKAPYSTIYKWRRQYRNGEFGKTNMILDTANAVRQNRSTAEKKQIVEESYNDV